MVVAAEDDRIIAATNGWVDPILKYMHCEALQVFTRGLKGTEGERLRGGHRGLGLYVGVATFAFAHSKGCTRAEILAINDDGVSLLHVQLQLQASLRHLHMHMWSVAVAASVTR